MRRMLFLLALVGAAVVTAGCEEKKTTVKTVTTVTHTATATTATH